MPTALKIFVNCIATVIISIGVVLLLVRWEAFLHQNGFWAYGFFNSNVPQPFIKPVIFLYDTVRFGVFGALCAGLMLGLRPRMVWLYAAVSTVTLFFALFIPMTIKSGDPFSIALAMMWLATIPVFYALFVRLSQGRHNNSLKRTP